MYESELIVIFDDYVNLAFFSGHPPQGQEKRCDDWKRILSINIQ